MNMKRVLSGFADSLVCATGCTETSEMHISDPTGPEPGSEPCRFPKLEECAHFHYERVQLPRMSVTIQTNMDHSLHSQHSHDDGEWHMVQVTSGEECWLLQRNLENFRMLDSQLHQCIYDRKISQLQDLSSSQLNETEAEAALVKYLERFSEIADNSINCGPVLNWLQMDNKGHRLLVPSEESRSINTPAVAAAYSVRRYVSQARDELNLEVGDMISVIDMASPGESIWWRGKRGFQVGFFPQHCVHIIGDKVPRNMPLPPPVVGSLALMSPIKPVLRKHGKLIAFFRSFILNRPSRRRLKQTGILKERVFGCDLGEHLSNSSHDVPMVLKCCTEFIETHGIVDGIYRLSGVTSNIQKLRNAFDEDRIPNLYNEDILQDIHSVASLLKMYFRELPNPLCTYQLYQSFVNAVQGVNSSVRNSETDNERLLKMREAVQKLPPPHYRTLEYLMRHLARVAKHSRNTGMTTRNLAIVWAPNLLRCAELEVGGVAALQGVGVQAVVTEFLICYTDLIFCDNLPNLDRPMEDFISSPRRSRPKSLAISTPTKLITLEEARTKHLLNKECGYIEVGGGPNSLPKKYHTIIELPPGTRKRGLSKRSPMGWRSFFSKSRTTTQVIPSKPRKASTPGIIVSEKPVTETDLADMKRVLRSVKSAESLTSGHSEPNSSDIDILGPLHSLSKPSGHNRSVSHDSYFDNLQDSHNNSEGSLLDLSEIQLNFELEESEMRIFSEDESLVSSPRVQRDGHRKVPTRNRFDEYLGVTQSNNPSPKKQPRVILSPESASRKRTRLEDQLSDIQFIDCNTPENSTSCILSTTAVVHTEKEEQVPLESYQPKNKSPRNSEIIEITSDLYKRQSLNLESTNNTPTISKSKTDIELSTKYPHYTSTTPTPQSPAYRPFVDSSTATTPDDCSPSLEIIYQKLKKSPGDLALKFKPPELSSPTKCSAPKSPTYENVLTTISIIYKSPTKTFTAKKMDSEYEDVDIKTENAQVPTSTANLPIQQAQCIECVEEKRPKSFNDLESLRKITPPVTETDIDALFASLKTTVDKGSVTDLSLSEVLNSSSECLDSNRTSFSLPLTPTRGTMSPNVSLTEMNDTLSQDLLTPVSFNDTSKNFSFNASKESLEKRSSETQLNESDEQNLITPSEEDNLSASLQHYNPQTNSNEIETECDNTLSELYDTYDSVVKEKLEDKEEIEDRPYENIEFNHDSVNLRENSDEVKTVRPKSINLIEFSPVTEEVSLRSPSNEKRKQTETVDDAVYQQVKYFRRSVHELNSLIDEEKNAEGTLNEPVQNNINEEIALDSLETEVEVPYENVEPDINVYENVTFSSDSLETTKSDIVQEILEPVDKVSVKSLTNKFEVADKTNEPENLSRKKVREPLPPCLRARNLKNSIKTRSLDEDEFRREFEGYKLTRRKSFDENLAIIKLNTLPKSLNKPKKLPEDGELQVHLNHSIENIQQSNPNLNRERIEKYKEERRKYLHDKYRSESFKEDKDVLLSRLKVFKPKEEEDAIKNKAIVKKKVEEIVLEPVVVKEEIQTSPKRVDIKSKTAIFEAKAVEDVELRPRRRDFSEKHRNTFDAREREPGDLAEGNKRNTFDIKPIRKDKSSTPSYCIKDMKAIFESKSHQ